MKTAIIIFVISLLGLIATSLLLKRLTNRTTFSMNGRNAFTQKVEAGQVWEQRSDNPYEPDTTRYYVTDVNGDYAQWWIIFDYKGARHRKAFSIHSGTKRYLPWCAKLVDGAGFVIVDGEIKESLEQP